MRLLISIALRQLFARKRQTVVSVLGIVLGVAFFLAISSLMQGSERDFISRLIDNTPHITIVDDYRNPRVQPAVQYFDDAAVRVESVKPVSEPRGIRGYEQILLSLRAREGMLASAVMEGQGAVSFAGRDVSISLYGMNPEEMRFVTTLDKYTVEGSIENLIANPDGIIIGQEMARKLSLSMGDNITVVSSIGQVRVFRIVGIFRTGRADIDERRTFLDLKRVQALLDRANRANSIIVKLSNPYQAREFASRLESQFGYKAVSWQEASEDIMNTLTIRNIIMYTVVSAVLIVAAFGIYNIVSTVVLEKQRDIAILKSIGFHARDVERIFLFQGVIVGIFGSLIGLPVGSAIMYGLMQFRFRPPGSTEFISMPMDWSWPQFAIATSFAIVAAVVAALLPARKAARVQPVKILRGSV